MRVAQILYRSSFYSIVASGLSLAATVLVIRGFGPTVYADYTIDLAWLSLILLILEAVPSSYAVFRIQDDPSWAKAIAAHALGSVIVVVAIVAIGGALGAFRAYSSWICVYVASLAIKRFLDITLQAEGRLPEFMRLEALAAFMRVLLLVGSTYVAMQGEQAVWAAMGLGTLLAQILWLALHKPERQKLLCFAEPAAWRSVWANRREYTPYYYGTLLKRVKDSSTPIAAAHVFTSVNVLAAFLLAYRGAVFALGQLRLVEAMLNHRSILGLLETVGWKRRVAVMAMATILCFAASALLMIISGQPEKPWLTAAVLSLIVWPVSSYMVERSKLYSDFQAFPVSVALASSIAAFWVGVLLMMVSDQRQPLLFAALLVLSESIAYAACKTIAVKWPSR